MSTELPMRRTPWTVQEYLSDMAEAWRNVVGGEPARVTLCRLLAQSCIECAHGGQSCWNNNISNIMGTSPEGLFHVLRKAPECALDITKIPGAIPLDPSKSTIVCAPGKSLYLPAGGSKFRAYSNRVRGCEDKLEVMGRLWPDAMMALVRGDTNGFAFVAGLLKGVHGFPYMTGSEAKYLAANNSITNDYLRSVDAGVWDVVMSSQSEEAIREYLSDLTGGQDVFPQLEGEHTVKLEDVDL